MGCCAHGAVLTRGINGGGGTLIGWQVAGSPACQFELGMAGMVAALHTVSVFPEHFACSSDEYGTKGFVPIKQGVFCQGDTTFEVLDIFGGDHEGTCQCFLCHRIAV